MGEFGSMLDGGGHDGMGGEFQGVMRRRGGRHDYWVRDCEVGDVVNGLINGAD